MLTKSHVGLMGNRSAGGTPLGLEPLEDRCVPAVFTVTNLDDAGFGSLRQAILDANIVGGADIIEFQAGLVGTITLASDMDAITDSVTIDASTTTGNIAVDGNANSFRPFTIDGAGGDVDVTFHDLTIQNGYGIRGGGIAIYGGDNNDGVTITNSTVTGNESSGPGGGIYAFQTNLTIQDSTISGNAVTLVGSGGGIYLTNGLMSVDPPLLSVTDSIISDNIGLGKGGGIYSLGADVVLDTVELTGNTARDFGGGVYLDGYDGVPTGRNTLSISNSLFDDNQATSVTGGGIYINEYMVGTIANTTISNNYAGTDGGGLSVNFSDITIENSSIIDNEAGDFGGGFTSFESEALTFLNSTISGNSAASGGGGINAFTNINIINSTISGNTSGTYGGGLYGAYAVNIINSTISGNSATITGGGIYLFDDHAVLNITNSTITGNTSGRGGGIYFTDSPFYAGPLVVNINNSIVSGNSPTTDGDDLYDGYGDAAGGTNNIFTTGGIVGTSGFDTGNLFVNDIGAVIDTLLADNGGPTFTHALLENSVALNAGDNALALDENGTTLTSDQRGFTPRIFGGTVDIGAFEFGANGPVEIASEVGDSTFQAFLVTITVGTSDSITLDELEVTNGVARLLVDNGDGTFSVTIAPNAIGPVTIDVPGRGDTLLVTTFDSLSFGSSDDDFIRNLYTVVYTRTPSDDEVAFWVQEMTEGATRKDVLAGFLASSEYTNNFTGNAAIIDGIYQLLFERDADTDFWTGLLDDGESLNDVVLGILSSQEYYDRLVRETYNEFLLRLVDEAGLAYWVDELIEGNINSDELRAQIANSAEAQAL